MILRVLAMALLAALSVVGLLTAPCRAEATVPLVDVTGKPVIKLKDGTTIYFLGGFEQRPQGGGTDDRTLAATFAFEDPSMLTKHERLIEIADLLFGGVVLTPADTQGYKRALVGFVVSETQAGDKTVQQREDIYYARREDAVWLRQAGPESWKTAQDPNAWTPPKVEMYDLGEYGSAEVTFFGEVAAIPGVFKVLGVEMRTDTVVETGRKFEEIRALWLSLDREKLAREGFNVAMLLNFAEKQRGKFHVRKFAFARLARPANGDWTKIPEGPLGPNGLPVVVASLAPMPVPDGDAMGIAASALLKAVRPAAETAIESGVATGESLRLRAVNGEVGMRATPYRAKKTK